MTVIEGWQLFGLMLSLCIFMFVFGFCIGKTYGAIRAFHMKKKQAREYIWGDK